MPPLSHTLLIFLISSFSNSLVMLPSFWEIHCSLPLNSLQSTSFLFATYSIYFYKSFSLPLSIPDSRSHSHFCSCYILSQSTLSHLSLSSFSIPNQHTSSPTFTFIFHSVLMQLTLSCSLLSHSLTLIP